MIVDNTCSEIGDVILFGPTTPVNGISGILGFTDQILGMTGERYFQKSFRYTLDGLNWTNWIELNTFNLINIPIDDTLDFNIEYKYERVGLDDTGILTWNWTNLATTKGNISCGDVFQSSVFSYFFSCCCNEETLQWCLNVLQKIYRPGIVALSMTRGSNDNEGDEDRDFIDLWRSITCYFALFVSYARRFENFDQDERLLNNYLTQRGLYLRDNQPKSDMINLMNRYYNEISGRGTSRIFDKTQPQGELIRLINYREIDELIVDISDSGGGNGWILNRTSPLYRGTSRHPKLNKLYDTSSSSPITNTIPLIPGTVAQYDSVYNDEGDRIIVVFDSPTQVTGIGFIGAPQDQFVRTVDPQLHYELSLLVLLTDDIPISIKIFGFDALGSAVDPVPVDILQSGNVVLDNVRLPKSNTYYEIKISIFPYTQTYIPTQSVLRTSLGVGNNVKLAQSINTIIPEITLNGPLGSGGKLFIKDMRLELSTTPYSKGFVGGGTLMELWIRNNSLQYSNKEISEILRQYIIPYKTGMINNFLNN